MKITLPRVILAILLSIPSPAGLALAIIPPLAYLITYHTILRLLSTPKHSTPRLSQLTRPPT